jgi:hypothetical protein
MKPTKVTYVIEYNLGQWVRGESIRCYLRHFHSLLAWVRMNTSKEFRIKRADHLVHDYNFNGQMMRKIGQ